AHASAEAAARLGAVAAAGARPYVAFNLSGRQLSDGALFDVVAASMDQFGLEPAQLRMEVTESLLMADLDQAAQLLGRCRELGLKLAVDDFGTGYSSLAYLSRFPVDVIKLDRSFVIPLGEPGDERPRVIVGGVLRLCRELGFDHVVEGVETEAQRALLRSLGCEQAQGYHFSRPRPLADWLASASPSPPLPVAS
ncbi:MAG TPA: EAL domain-containing protein, partial [Nevskiaceae bacterium]|nr:EAL domain-containing protein [Nevskiaceae bacterium]